MTDRPGEGEGSSVWDRLRRRKVVQWGLAYAAGAWGLQQGVAYVSTLVGWPVSLQRLTGLALLLGVPIALVLAWYHGDKGQRRVTRTELAILTLLFLLGGGLFAYYQRSAPAPSGAIQTTASPADAVATIPTDRSIAVLPFVNMSSDQEQEYFSDGLSEELLNLLAQVPQLRVIARTSSFSFKGKEADIAEIAEKLNVAHVLEGSVRRSGDTLRITAQLIRTSDSSNLWSQTYDRQLTDVFAVQDEIADSVVKQLKIRLLGAPPKAKETDPRAYALFLRAREVHRQHNAEAFRQSIDLYQQALAIDSAYAPAWDRLARVYFEQVDLGLLPPERGLALGQEALNHALAHDPAYAPAYGGLAEFEAFVQRDYATAARRLEQGLALDPANLDLIGTASNLARRLGRLETAIALGEYQVARDPVNLEGYDALALAYRYNGERDKSIAAYRTLLSLSPEAGWVHTALGHVLLQNGDAVAALAEYQKEPVECFRLGGTSMAYHALGRAAQSDAALAEMKQKCVSSKPFHIALALAYRGDVDEAFEMLYTAADFRDVDLGAAAISPLFANLHDDPRWLPFLREHGMAPEQLAAIKFDVKLPD